MQPRSSYSVTGESSRARATLLGGHSGTLAQASAPRRGLVEGGVFRTVDAGWHHFGRLARLQRSSVVPFRLPGLCCGGHRLHLAEQARGDRGWSARSFLADRNPLGFGGAAQTRGNPGVAVALHGRLGGELAHGLALTIGSLVDLQQAVTGGPRLLHTVVGVTDLRRQQPRPGGIRSRAVVLMSRGRKPPSHTTPVQRALHRLLGRLVLLSVKSPGRDCCRLASWTRRHRVLLRSRRVRDIFTNSAPNDDSL